jgi:hypothetical protein
MIEPASPDVAAFVRAASAFCAFIESAHELSLEERLARARETLLALYSAATRLPKSEKVSERQPPGFPLTKQWPGFEDRDVYWEVFDPYEHAAPLNGSLSDDLGDVYDNIQRGLWFWNENERSDALWEWRFLFEIHWGDHAIDALRALHRACKHVDDDT